MAGSAILGATSSPLLDILPGTPSQLCAWPPPEGRDCPPAASPSGRPGPPPPARPRTSGPETGLPEFVLVKKKSCPAWRTENPSTLNSVPWTGLPEFVLSSTLNSTPGLLVLRQGYWQNCCWPPH